MVTSFVKIGKRYVEVGKKEYIRAIATGNIKGEIREQAYRVSITEICETLSIQKL